MYKDNETYSKGYIALPYLGLFRKCCYPENGRPYFVMEIQVPRSDMFQGGFRFEREFLETIKGYENKENHEELKEFDCYRYNFKEDGSYKMPSFSEVSEAIETAKLKIEKNPECAEIIKKQNQEDEFIIKYGNVAFKYNDAKENLMIVRKKAEDLKDDIDSSILLSVAKELTDAENAISKLEKDIEEIDNLLLKITEKEKELSCVKSSVKQIKSEFINQTTRTPEILKDYASKLAQYELMEVNSSSELDTYKTRLRELKGWQ